MTTTWVVPGLTARQRGPEGAGRQRPAGDGPPSPAPSRPRPRRRRRSTLGGWLTLVGDVLVAVAVTVSLVAGDTTEPERTVRLCVVDATNCRGQGLDAEPTQPLEIDRS